jgi:hypothetical protein
MHIQTQIVKKTQVVMVDGKATKQKVVIGSVNVELPDSVAEAVEMEGEQGALDYICRQKVTDTANRFRVAEDDPDTRARKFIAENRKAKKSGQAHLTGAAFRAKLDEIYAQADADTDTEEGETEEATA